MIARRLRQSEMIIAKVSETSPEPSWRDTLNIAVTHAHGGKIITFRRYDSKRDEHNNRVYVLHDELDFNAELAKLITLESMRGS